ARKRACRPGRTGSASGTHPFVPVSFLLFGRPCMGRVDRMSMAWAFRFGPALVPAFLVLLALVFSMSSLISPGSRFTCRVGNVCEGGGCGGGSGGVWCAIPAG